MEELNEYGLLMFENKNNPEKTLKRAYRWVDRALITINNEIIEDVKFSEINLDEWIPIRKEEYESQKFAPIEIRKYIEEFTNKTYQLNNGNLDKESFRLGMYSMWFYLNKK